MASTLGAAAGALPSFARTEDGSHIEVHSGSYHYVVMERGCELERRRTPRYEELLYRIFADVTRRMAVEYELRHRVENQDWRRIAFPRQLELMAKLGPAFEERMRRDIERTLAKQPYDDVTYSSAGQPKG